MEMPDAEEFLIEADDTKDEDKKKPRPVVRTAVDLQRLKLEKLMKNPEKPVIIPEQSKERDFLQSVPNFVRNVMGSSAGAGSGEFHVYRHLRRKEYARMKFIQSKSLREKLDDEFQAKLEQNRLIAEQKTAKKRAKRLKKKKGAKQKRCKKQKNDPDPGTESPNDESSSEESENDTEKEDSKNNDEMAENKAGEGEDGKNKEEIECSTEVMESHNKEEVVKEDDVKNKQETTDDAECPKEHANDKIEHDTHKGNDQTVESKDSKSNTNEVISTANQDKDTTENIVGAEKDSNDKGSNDH